MHVGIPATEGNIRMWELKLCLGCCRMIDLSEGNWMKVWVTEQKHFIYKHKKCPAIKPHVEIFRHMLK